MSFKKFEEHKPHRFRDLEEARVYIEDMEKNPELTKEAIDYFILHKEYYFLLKNMVRQFYKGGGNKELFDYVFSRLNDCPKRSYDIELYLKILESPNVSLRESFVGYLKSCAEELYSFIVDLLKSEKSEDRKLAICVLKYLPKEEVKENILSIIKNEREKTVIEEILDYLSIYLSKNEVNCLNIIKDKFPEFDKRIKEIIDSI